MLHYNSNVPIKPCSIKKINHSISKEKYCSLKELPKRSKSNTNYSINYNRIKNTSIEKALNHNQNNCKSKPHEREKDFNYLNFSINAKAFDSNLSLSGSHINISLNHLKRRNHSESFSNLIPKKKEDTKMKVKTFEDLRLNFSQDKLKLKKVVTVKVDQHYSLSNNKSKRNEDNANEDKPRKRIRERIKDEKPFKLQTEGNTNCPTAKHNESTIVLNTSNHLYTSDSNLKSTNAFTKENTANSQLLKDLEQKLLNKLNQNKTNSKSKKYNTIKGIFEEMIKLFPSDNQLLFLKLLSGYHEVVSAFANENKGLRETNEILQNRLFQLEKTNINENNQLKEKDREIINLKKRLAEIEKNPDQFVFSKSTNTSTQMQVSSNEKEAHSNDNEHIKNNFITDINKDNLEDLDALYFFDKVQMNTENIAQHSIPVLPINIEQEQNRKKEKQSKILYTNILNKLKPGQILPNSIILPKKSNIK